jgi:hypothetical protein
MPMVPGSNNQTQEAWFALLTRRLTNGLAEGKRICTNAATVTGLVKWANLLTEQIGTLRHALFAKERGKHSGLYARLTATSA